MEVVALLPHIIMIVEIFSLFVPLSIHQSHELEEHECFACEFYLIKSCFFVVVLIRHFAGRRAITLHPLTSQDDNLSKLWMKGFMWNLDGRQTTMTREMVATPLPLPRLQRPPTVHSKSA